MANPTFKSASIDPETSRIKVPPHSVEAEQAVLDAEAKLRSLEQKLKAEAVRNKLLHRLTREIVELETDRDKKVDTETSEVAEADKAKEEAIQARNDLKLANEEKKVHFYKGCKALTQVFALQERKVCLLCARRQTQGERGRGPRRSQEECVAP